jgi:ribosomal protein L37AE/L43A
MSDRDSLIRDLKESWSKSSVIEPKNCPKCGQPMEYCQTGEGENAWMCQNCNVTIPTSKMAFAMTPSWKRIVKYFAHGIAFSVLFIGLEIVWISSSFFLIAIGSILGLIIGILILFLILGVVNSIVSRFVWGFSMKTSTGSIFFHGLVLFLILIAVEIVLLLPALVFVGNPIVTTVRFIVSCFLYGLIGEKVAENWTEDRIKYC